MERRFLITGLVLLAALTVAQANTFTTIQNSNLLFAAGDLLTNGVPGLTNPPPQLRVSSVPSSSVRGGTVTLVNTQAWVQRYNGSGSNYDTALKVVVDGLGNVIATGYSFEAGSGFDFTTIKYSSSGSALWTNRYDGPSHGNDGASLLAVDGAHNVYVSGDSRNASNVNDIVTIKYSADGYALWTNRCNNGATNLQPAGLAVDATGNVYLLFDASGDTGGPYCAYVLAKYDTFGNPVWVNRFKTATNSSDHPKAVALDGDGNVFVTGASGPQPMPDDDSSDFVTLKYSSDGTSLWTNRLMLGANEQPSQMVVDLTGDIIVTGQSFGVVSSLHLYATVKYANSGAPLWTNILAGPTYRGDIIPRVAVDPSGNVFITGGSTTEDNHNDYTTTTVKFTKDGIPLWTNRFYAAWADAALLGGTVTDCAGSFYFTGVAGTVFAPNYDFLTVKYSGDGTPLWTNRYNGPMNTPDYANDIAVDSRGNVCVAGRSDGESCGNDCRDFVVVNYSDYIRYSPPTNFFGTDSFTFTAVDPLGHSATNFVSVIVIPATLQFNTIATNFQFTPQGLRLQVDGARGTNAVVLCASTNLVDWQFLATNTPALGSVQFLDSAATNLAQRFYRAVQ